jgi:hypothetical protein
MATALPVLSKYRMSPAIAAGPRAGYSEPRRNTLSTPGRTRMGLLDFLFGRRNGEDRDGSTPENAVVVNSIGEEYAWMQRHYPGFQPAMQALSEIDGKPYDVLTWRNTRGEEKIVYFDISKFFGS